MSEPGSRAYNYSPPEFLNQESVASALMGETWTWKSARKNVGARLLITNMLVADVHARIGPLTDIQCVNLFLEELRNSHRNFFVATMTRPLVIGQSEHPRFRWSGENAGRSMTGVLSCGRMKNNYFVIHFSDDVRRATQTFPAIRHSLKTISER